MKRSATPDEHDEHDHHEEPAMRATSLNLLLAALLPTLASCTPEVDDDLRGWAARARSAAPEPAGDASAVPAAQAFVYDHAGRRDPFDASALSGGLTDPDPRSRSEASRPRELLEGFQLDSLQMVGTLRRADKAVAVVQAEQGLHQVRVGDHLGQDHGEVTAISESAIAITERVQDSNGIWQSRETRLELRRGNSK
jgi:Tfp pilus assembly protein PilP